LTCGSQAEDPRHGRETAFQQQPHPPGRMLSCLSSWRDEKALMRCHALGRANRSAATARRRWPHKTVAVTSHQATFDDYLAGGIPAHRILSHLAGEALRLEAYAATGVIDPDEPVPATVLDAARDPPKQQASTGAGL
jgi:hypothetical protein